jgi:hypothetical protein
MAEVCGASTRGFESRRSPLLVRYKKTPIIDQGLFVCLPNLRRSVKANLSPDQLQTHAAVKLSAAINIGIESKIPDDPFAASQILLLSYQSINLQCIF